MTSLWSLTASLWTYSTSNSHSTPNWAEDTISTMLSATPHSFHVCICHSLVDPQHQTTAELHTLHNVFCHSKPTLCIQVSVYKSIRGTDFTGLSAILNPVHGTKLRTDMPLSSPQGTQTSQSCTLQSPTLSLLIHSYFSTQLTTGDQISQSCTLQSPTLSLLLHSRSSTQLTT